MGVFSSRRDRDGGFQPSLMHRLLRPMASGNTINGLGEPAKRRPTPIYHHKAVKVVHERLQNFFYLRLLPNRRYWPSMRDQARLEKRPPAPISDEKSDSGPSANATAIKAFALANGADIVGITAMRDEYVFEGYDTYPNYPSIVMLGVRMDHAKLMRIVDRGVDSIGGAHIIDVYNHGTHTARRLADHIRGMGFTAEGNCGPMAGAISLIPPALAAGLGELGKHGSIINRELGANFRLAYVLTDMPLAQDGADHFGVDEFCASCQLCRRNCPPDAIYDAKQWVRGEKKWYVDFDKCVAYFNDSQGCGICLAVCPWSRPGVGPKLAQKMLKKQALAAE